MAIAAGRSLRSADFGSFDMMLSPFRGHVNPGPINPWAVTNTEREIYICVCKDIYILYREASKQLITFGTA